MEEDKEEGEEKEVISYERAIEMLPKRERVHTLRCIGPVELGIDVDKNKLLEKMKNFQETIELTGPNARSVNHGVVLRDDKGLLFIETKEVSS